MGSFRGAKGDNGGFASFDPVLPQLLAERRAVDAEHLGGGGSIAATLLENCPQQRGLDDREEPLVERRLAGLGKVRSGLLDRPAGRFAPGFLAGSRVPSDAMRRSRPRGDARRESADRGRRSRRARWRSSARGRCPPRDASEALRARAFDRWISATFGKRGCFKKCSARRGMSSRRSRKRRDVDREHAQAKEEILAELTRRPSARRAAGWWRR